MTAKLEKEIRREVIVDGMPHTVVLTGAGVHLTPKGGRTPVSLSWKDMKNGKSPSGARIESSSGSVTRGSAMTDEDLDDESIG